tara:strand:- start:74 stop:796 length:723 start_codon:yes stop_codon:yes gene_type:complete
MNYQEYMTKEKNIILENYQSKKDVKSFLDKVAVTPYSKKTKARVLFALDATASRQPTWDIACNIQAEMFETAISLGGMEIQVVYFQGFGEFRAFPWLSHSEELIKLMTRVTCLGGFTQIGKLLDHILAEHKKKKLDAVIFVGDSVEENFEDLVSKAGKIGLLGVPIFIFQEGKNEVASFVFSKISTLTNGVHCFFDANSANQLKNLLKAVVVYAAGGKKALESFSRVSGDDVRLLLNKIK